MVILSRFGGNDCLNGRMDVQGNFFSQLSGTSTFQFLYSGRKSGHLGRRFNTSTHNHSLRYASSFPSARLELGFLIALRHGTYHLLAGSQHSFLSALSCEDFRIRLQYTIMFMASIQHPGQ